MSKKKHISYVLSALAVLIATVLIVIAPDISSAVSSAKMNTEVTYKSTVAPVSNPLTAVEVAQAYAKGDFLYSYTHARINYDDLRASAVKVAQELFAEEQDFCKEITEIIRTASIYSADTTSVLVMASDRLATMEIVRIDFAPNLTISFEENTGLVIEFIYIPRGVPDEEARHLQSVWEYSAEAYYLSTISASDVEYEVLSEVYEENAYLCIYIKPMWGYEGGKTYEVIS